MSALAGRRVLVVDDNEDIRRDLVRLLGGPGRRAFLGARAAKLFPDEALPRSRGAARPEGGGGDESAPTYDVTAASSGDEALALARAARAEGRPFGLAFVDVRMPPGIDGARVARVLRDEDQDVEVVLITAYADRTLGELNAGPSGSDRLLFLKKPYAHEEVSQLALSLTEKRSARREAREARERLQTILEATRDGLVGLDRGHRVAFANPSARTLLGLAELPDEGAGLWQRLALCRPRAVGGGAIELESRGRWLELGDVAPAAGGGEVASVVAVRDLTARKEVERLKDEFVQNTSHELRTPLVAIRGYLDLALEGRLGPLSPPLRRGLDVAARASGRLLDLIDALLELTRLEAQKGNGVALERVPVDLGEVVRRTAEIARPLAEAKGLALGIAIDPDVGPVLGEERTLEVALRNLVGNAVKFTARGEVAVAVRSVGGRVRVEVTDTGIGLPEGVDPAVLFERFRQGDGSTSREHGGVGIGLSLVQRILALHGSRVVAGNRPGGGAAFSFELEPAGPGAVLAAAPSPPETRVAVLVVTPERELREFLAFALGAAGHDVSAAATIDEALEAEPELEWGLAILAPDSLPRAEKLFSVRARTGLASPRLARLVPRGSPPPAEDGALVLETPVAVERAVALAALARRSRAKEAA